MSLKPATFSAERKKRDDDEDRGNGAEEAEERRVLPFARVLSSV